jgi:hypothetical protein
MGNVGRLNEKLDELCQLDGHGSHRGASWRWTSARAHRKFHRQQEAVARGRKSELCVGTIVAILTSYRRQIKQLNSVNGAALRNS